MLLAAVNGLRDQVEASRLPLALPDAPAAGKVDPVRAATLLAQKLAVNESAAKPAPAAAKKED